MHRNIGETYGRLIMQAFIYSSCISYYQSFPISYSVPLQIQCQHLQQKSSLIPLGWFSYVDQCKTLYSIRNHIFIQIIGLSFLIVSSIAFLGLTLTLAIELSSIWYIFLTMKSTSLLHTCPNHLSRY